MADVVKVVQTHILLCASNSYVMEPEGVTDLIAPMPTLKCAELVDVPEKICFYYHKTGTIRPVLSKTSQGPTKPTISLMELNIFIQPHIFF